MEDNKRDSRPSEMLLSNRSHPTYRLQLNGNTNYANTNTNSSVTPERSTTSPNNSSSSSSSPHKSLLLANHNNNNNGSSNGPNPDQLNNHHQLHHPYSLTIGILHCYFNILNIYLKRRFIHQAEIKSNRSYKNMRIN